MPYRVKYKGKHQRRASRKSRPPWGLIPLVALIIFAAVYLAESAGLSARLEDAVATAARQGELAQGIIRLILPDGQSAGDAPAPEPEATRPAVRLPDEPFWQETIPPEPDEHHGESTALSEEEVRLYLPEPLVFESVMPELTGPEGQPSTAVSALTISGQEGGYEGSGSVYMRNDTDFAIDTAALLGRASPVKLSGDGVQVLIMHTHGTEAYTPDSLHQYEASDPDRTTDATRNVLRVGREIERILTENGIRTVHSETLNDYPAYNGSYNRALADITQYVKDNPSIKVVIDVHRDAMVSQNGTKYKTVAAINGKDAAQLMFVTGTNAGGLTHDRWQDNLAFQLKLHDRLNTRYPGIMRPINIRTGRFNQHVTTGSMLLEVGTSGNSLSEALYSAQLFAQELADLLNNK